MGLVELEVTILAISASVIQLASQWCNKALFYGNMADTKIKASVGTLCLQQI